ncbi:outer membrane receptor for ferrienterochelin and colicins [Ancylomarina subtilis]|uniref:Outer membrane receptor for ferrienterochelin and colicins n=2 Tax=Ancylomarina subtilis TaxID=1639035 RepID=A0A4Q7V8H6_9BACT|nr:outer membrane receptor for ferrienterochelin and colicins [Ancylomarina subtilis]
MGNEYSFMKNIIISLAFLMLAQFSFSQKKNNDAVIVGHVVCNGKHIPFLNIIIKGTTIGVSTDATGHYRLIDLPLGKLTVVATGIGYKSLEKTTVIKANETIELNFNIVEDVLGIDEVVVTGDKGASKRTEAPVIVSSLSPKLFSVSQSVVLSESLNFSPGLRMETNCQNCGFNQVRMNGMEGPYSQILINSRPIFSGLAGVYGLELIPTNMIEKVEIVRGGGSALYGSNAIAGTINMILKDPLNDAFEIGASSSLIGVGADGASNPALDYNVNFNASVVSDDYKTGLSVYGFYRDKEAFDANNDGFSELTQLDNTTVGSRFFHRLGFRGKLAVDFFHINEERRGGNKFNYLPHEADITEQLEHKLTTTAISYDQFFRDEDKLSIYLSGQKVDRASYYGVEQSLADYGQTDDFTYNIGVQYNGKLENSSFVLGVENTSSSLKDKKLGYFDYANNIHTDNIIVADQTSSTAGLFGQYTHKLNSLSISLGGRFDHYQIKDKSDNGKSKDINKSGNVFSPRINILYDILPELQFRLSYSQGYRAPQIFDEDLHIVSSTTQRIIHKNSPNLKKETSQSYMTSLDYNTKIGSTKIGFLVEGFHTRLDNAFVNIASEPDANKVVVYTRANAENGAVVYGINAELNIIPSNNFSLTAGFTSQKSKYEEAQDIAFGKKEFMRTPNNYGFMTIDWDFSDKWCISTSGNYTGKMYLPYYGNTIANPIEGELRESSSFMDLGTKIEYTTKINEADVQFWTGVKNIFNAYQNDFDKNVDRDPNYIYGPGNPRTVSFGIKIGNLL